MSAIREETVSPPGAAEALATLAALLKAGNEPLRLVAADGAPVADWPTTAE